MSDERTHKCPICKRVNGAGDGDFCEHYQGYIYDDEFFDAACAEEFNLLWHSLERIYHDRDEPASDRIIDLLNQRGFSEIATALENDDVYWWTDSLQTVPIEAEASLASGSGLVLYASDADEIGRVMQLLREASAYVQSWNKR